MSLVMSMRGTRRMATDEGSGWYLWLVLLLATLAGCGDEDTCTAPEDICAPDPNYDPVIDHADFVATVDNPL